MNDFHTFRGRTMQEAVAKLKATLGPDAVIVKTNRGEDARGRYVEIDAQPPLPEEGPADHLAAYNGEEAPAMAGRVGASAAYARVARTAPKPTLSAPTRPAAPPIGQTPSRPMGQTPARTQPAHVEVHNPFAERAALLAQQVALPQLAAESNQALRGELSTLRGAVERLGERSPDTVTEAQLHRVADDLAAQLRQLSGLVSDRLTERSRPAPSPAARAWRERLIAVGLNSNHAADLVRRLAADLEAGSPDDAEVLATIGCALATDLPCTGELMPLPGTRRVLALVGSTGVGKTTTIAKLAARAKLEFGLRVGLVTVDTFRIAAVDQLSRYAEILQCPLAVVKRPEELEGVLEELSECDLVLVDTTGRNPRAEDEVRALSRYFPKGWGGEVILSIAANTRERDAFATIDAFAPLLCSALCITKLDETDAVGVVYSLARRSGRPVAFLTEGQRVPEDLSCADAAALAARIVMKANEVNLGNASENDLRAS